MDTYCLCFRLLDYHDAAESIEACLEMRVTPHVAQNTSGRRSEVPDEIVCGGGYAISQQKRKRIEQGFGCAETVGRMRQVMVRGLKGAKSSKIR